MNGLGSGMETEIDDSFGLDAIWSLPNDQWEGPRKMGQLHQTFPEKRKARNRSKLPVDSMKEGQMENSKEGLSAV